VRGTGERYQRRHLWISRPSESGRQSEPSALVLNEPSCYHFRAFVPRLDEAEGLGHGYERQLLDIKVGGSAVPAFVYTATEGSVDDSLIPHDWYRHLVVTGAKAWQIPAVYIASIEAVRSGLIPLKPDRSANGHGGVLRRPKESDALNCPSA
jgi:hypothetical protein